MASKSGSGGDNEERSKLNEFKKDLDLAKTERTETIKEIEKDRKAIQRQRVLVLADLDAASDLSDSEEEAKTRCRQIKT